MIGPRTLLAALLLAASTLVPATAAADLFSPGELARAHSALEGLKNCTQCHEAGQGLSQQRCLNCHTELKGRVEQGKGLHGRIEESQRACESCHHEHQGRAFRLIEWRPSMKAFAHEETGYPLRGGHRKVDCAKCHDERLVVEDAIRQLIKKQPERKTFLGLAQRCESCHFDEHRGQLEGSCAECHDEQQWEKAPGFDHDQTGYPLTGRHRKVACGECHEQRQDATTPKGAFPAPVSRDFLGFGDQPHETCLDCHADPHEGKFPQRCESCHSTADWHAVRTPGGDRSFHDKTRYPLKGMHAEVDCRACHGPFPGQRARFKGMRFQACTDCHADAHEGQLAAMGKPLACDGCHTVEGFVPAGFEAEDHARLAFPLEGAHQSTACSGCHPSDEALLRRVPEKVRKLLLRQKRKQLFSLVRLDVGATPSSCESCHADVHAGQFAGRKDNKACSSCHVTEAFSRLDFDHRRDTGFPLEGGHEKAACASCHRPERIGRLTAVRYRGVASGCASCHADVHAGQFAEGGRTDCTRCHDTEDFRKTAFVHRAPFTDFVLDGKHAEAKCESCHPAIEAAAATVRKYAGVPKSCAGCHKDFHEGAFEGFTP